MAGEPVGQGGRHPLLTVMEEVIGCERLSPTDDFYLVGGHSLLIVRITRRLADQYGISLDPRCFGVNAQLAALIAACRPIGAPDAAAGPA